MRILVVEDDPAIAEPLRRGLERAGFVVDHVATGRGALEDRHADLVLLDLGLPDMEGTDVCRQLRSTRSVPVIIVSARGEEIDRVVGLELGADDYVVKPFGIRELVARIRAVARRSRGADRALDAAGAAVVDLDDDLVLDRRTRRVLRGDAELGLTRKEFDLLALLAEDPGATRTRDEILARVWDENWYGPTKTLDVHVASLRRKLGDPELIETVRGVGYRLRDGARRPRGDG